MDYHHSFRRLPYLNLGITFLVAILLSGNLLAQDLPKEFLLLKRGSQQKSQVRYYPGEYLTYKSNKIGYFVTDKIVDLDTEFIYLSENILKPSDIVAIAIQDKDPRNYTLSNLTRLFLGAGTMILALEAANSLYQQEQIQISSGVATASALLVGTGLALRPLRYKTFTLSEKNRLQLVLLEIE
jgi:hypothetical protein